MFEETRLASVPEHFVQGSATKAAEASELEKVSEVAYDSVNNRDSVTASVR